MATPNHVAFHATDRASVDAFYKAAIAAGGRDNGHPGPREGYGYAAFVLDPDGHNLEAVIWEQQLETAGSKRASKPASARRVGRSKKAKPKSKR